jgi:thiol-disulfide isomerase/thioredoxin
MSTAVIKVNSPDHFRSLLSEDLQRMSLINFWAPWAAPCQEMNELAAELAEKYPELLVLQVLWFQSLHAPFSTRTHIVSGRGGGTT